MNKKNILLFVILIIIVIFSIYFFTPEDSKDEVQKIADSEIKVENPATSLDCASPIKFTHHFTDINKIDSIIPPVFKNSKGIMPTTLINSQGKVPLYMPVSGKIVQGSYYTEQVAEFYMWEIDVGCGVTIVFDHVTEPVEKIRKLFPNTTREDTRTDFFNNPIEMEAGDLVGYTTGSVNAHNWNFAVYNRLERNYLWETNKFTDLPKYYTQVCPLKYYDKPMAEVYEALFVLSFNEITIDRNLCIN